MEKELKIKFSAYGQYGVKSTVDVSQLSVTMKQTRRIASVFFDGSENKRTLGEFIQKVQDFMRTTPKPEIKQGCISGGDLMFLMLEEFRGSQPTEKELEKSYQSIEEQALTPRDEPLVSGRG